MKRHPARVWLSLSAVGALAAVLSSGAQQPTATAAAKPRRELPPGLTYLPEIGETNVGEWVTHRRPMLADYRAAVGGEAPKKIVAVWFIANSFFLVEVFGP